jgi:hypothetical protein
MKVMQEKMMDINLGFGAKQASIQVLQKCGVSCDYRAERQITEEDQKTVFVAVETIQTDNEFLAPAAVKANALKAIKAFAEKMEAVAAGIDAEDEKKRSDIDTLRDDILKLFESAKVQKAVKSIAEEYSKLRDEAMRLGTSTGMLKLDLQHRDPKRKEAIEKAVGPFYALWGYLDEVPR